MEEWLKILFNGKKELLDAIVNAARTAKENGGNAEQVASAAVDAANPGVAVAAAANIPKKLKNKTAEEVFAAIEGYASTEGISYNTSDEEDEESSNHDTSSAKDCEETVRREV